MSKTKAKSIGITILNLFLILFDIIIVGVILYSFAVTILLLLGTIALSYGIWNNVLSAINTYFSKPCEITIAELVADIGVYASIALLPVVSFFVSSHLANKQNDRRICEALAKTKDINFYIADLPLGIWNGLVESYHGYCAREQKLFEKCRPLLNFDYCFHLVFEGEFFQSYKIDIIDIGYDTYFDVEGAHLKRPEPQYIYTSMTFTSDTTGAFCGSFCEGTSLVALVDNGDYSPMNYYLGVPKENDSKNIFYELHIEQRDDTENDYFSQMFRRKFGKNVRFFPLIRFFYQVSQMHHKKMTSYRLDLYLDSLATALTPNKSKYQMAIYDLDIRTIRKERKKRLK